MCDMTAYTMTCCSSPPNEPGRTQFFVSMQINWRSTDLGPAQTKFYGTSPGPELPTDATARARSVLGGPSPRRGNASDFRRTFEARGLGAHFARWTRAAAPCPTRTPLTTTWSFMSRHHQSRGHQRSRTGRQSGQAIMRGRSASGDESMFICV